MGQGGSTSDKIPSAPPVGTKNFSFSYEGKTYNAKRVTTESGVQHYTIEELGKLPTFSHASIAPNGNVKISGCIGFELGTMNVGSNVADETTKALTHIDCILTCIGASVENLTKVNVFLKDAGKERFKEYDTAYGEFFAKKNLDFVPPRITVGCGELALGANMEIEADAFIALPSIVG